MRELNIDAIERIAEGAAVLGAGGGGDPYIGKLMAVQAIETNGPVRLLDAAELPDDALVVPTAMMGAPTVSVEKLPGGKEAFEVFRVLGSYLGEEIHATFPVEAGGINSMIPLVLAANTGIPVVDTDGMGRAFPEVQMVTFHLYGVSASPMVLGDEKGNTVLLKTIDNQWAERLARRLTVEMGGSVTISLYSMRGSMLKKSGIHRTLTRAERIGGAILESKCKKRNPIEAVLKAAPGYELFRGKITDIARSTDGAFVKGTAACLGIEEYHGSGMVLEFQNEHLIARCDDRVMASVPDLIALLDPETARPVTTEGLKYGYRVSVIGIPCDEKWRTPEGLELVGPKYFGYDIPYRPVEQLAAEKVGKK